MSDQFTFHGQTTFIDKPSHTVIRDFQNSYLSGEAAKDEVVNELKRLVELLLSSKDLSPTVKEDAVQAVHDVADKVNNGSGSRLSVKATLEAIKGVVDKAADVAGPAIGVITSVLKLLGMG